jgi:hypothetical protein
MSIGEHLLGLWHFWLLAALMIAWRIWGGRIVELIKR